MVIQVLLNPGNCPNLFFLQKSIFYFNPHTTFEIDPKEAIAKIQGGIEVEELIKITVNNQTASNLTWIEDHEFRFEGKMYDIVYTERSSTNTVYYCYSDNEETELYAALNRVIKRLKNHKKDSIVKIIKVFRYNSENTICRFGKSFQKNPEIVDTYFMIYKSLTSKVSVPPPQFS